MSRPPEPIDVAPEEVQDPFSRFAAIAIVVATLAGALVGYLEARASRAGELANVRAQSSMVRAMSGLVRADRAAQVDYGSFVVADRELHEATNSLQRQLFASGQDERALELAQERFRELSERTLKLTRLSFEGPLGPERDRTFPSRFFADSQRKADRLWALADAANAEDAGWEAREANLTAVLTLFAVAVYLLGLSLTLRERVRLLLAGVGSLLVVVGGLWAGLLALTPPTRAPDAAAGAFARGRQALFLATEREGFRRAAEQFTRAIELRPTFAQAYVERAQARFRAGSPQRAVFTSVSTPRALRSSSADLKRALELGLETRPVLGDLGFHTFLLGLQTEDQAELERSLGFTEEAIAADPTDPVGHYNRGVTLLAMGRAEEARASYREGARHTIYADVAERTLRQNPGTESEWVAGALTDLELLISELPDLADEALAMKELVVGSVSRQQIGVGEATVETTGVTVDTFSSKVQWQAPLPGFDPERDAVSAQWYRRTAEGWVGLPEASGTVGPMEQEGAWFAQSVTLPVTFPPRCLEDGTYRVELYVNGHLAGTGESEHRFGALTPTVADDVNVGLCRPAAWQRYDGEVPGLIEGSVAADGSEGVYVFRLQPPTREEEDPVAESRGWLRAMIDSFQDIFPAPPTFDREASEQFFLALEGPVVHWYTYEGGSVIAGAGLARDGAVILAAIFGPEERFGEDLLPVFDSLVELRPL